MANYSTITFNGVTLNVTSVNASKKQKTRKSVIGKKLIQTNIIGLADWQWELSVTGIIMGTSQANLGINRAAVEVLDDAASHALVDGIHDGTYYMSPGSLSFADTGENAGMKYNYTCRLIEE